MPVTKKQLTEDNDVFFSSLLLNTGHKFVLKYAGAPFLLGWGENGHYQRDSDLDGARQNHTECSWGHRVPQEGLARDLQRNPP